MRVLPVIALALPGDARAIAERSRDDIEHGLSWSWTPARVLRAIRDPATNVAVVRGPLGDGDGLQGFGIMQYGEDTAHLALLAVHPVRRHQGLGAQLLHWLEQSAGAAGIRRIRLEARADNAGALAFYRRLGFTPSGQVAGYYEGRIDSVQLERRL